MGLDIEVILLSLYQDIDDMLKKGPELTLKEMISGDLDYSHIRCVYMYRHSHRNHYFQCQPFEKLMTQWEKALKHECQKNTLFLNNC